MSEIDLFIRMRELTKELLQDLGITDGLKEIYSDQPAQAEKLIQAYRKYYKQAFRIFHQPT